MRGLLKSVYRRSDTYECVNGSSSDIGANDCFIESDSLIQQYKRRGLDVVGTHNDADSIRTESIALIALSLGLLMIIFCRCFFAFYKVKWEELSGRSSVFSGRRYSLRPSFFQNNDWRR